MSAQGGSHLSDLEALMWTLEKDPHLSSWTGSLTVFDQPPDATLLRERVAGAVRAIPRLRQRIAPSLGRLVPPEWRDDVDFDLDHHLRTVGLPAGDAPADERLSHLAAELNSAAIDRTRPLWEFTVITGFPDGRAAMLQRLHHTVTDGEGGLRIAEQFIDLERDATGPMVEPRPDATEAPPRDLLSLASETVGHLGRRGVGIASRTLGSSLDLLRHPNELGRVAGEANELARSTLAQLRSDPARSPLWTERTLRRDLATVSSPFRPLKDASRRLGGTLNDAFVTAVAGAIGEHHAAAGTPVDELRMAMPVSTRSGAGAGGNAFAPLRVLVPTGEMEVADRFDEVRRRLTTTKGERAAGSIEGVAGLANLLPTALLVRVAREQTGTVDFATSNVRGPNFPTYLAGAKILATYPIGPLSGVPVNVTVLSYDGSLDLGVHVDAGAAGEARPLADRIAAGLEAVASA